MTERTNKRDVCSAQLTTELTMADRTTLGTIGYLLTGVTLAVCLTGALVVTNHTSGRWSFDGVVSTSAKAAVPN